MEGPHFSDVWETELVVCVVGGKRRPKAAMASKAMRRPFSYLSRSFVPDSIFFFVVLKNFDHSFALEVLAMDFTRSPAMIVSKHSFMVVKMDNLRRCTASPPSCSPKTPPPAPC
jgi:hypothetical protein